MANEQNLKPFNTLSADKHRALSRRGGKASGAARRAKRERITRLKEERAAELDLISECVKLLKKI